MGASPGMKEKEFESGAAADSSASLSHLSLPSPLPTQTQRKALFGRKKQNLSRESRTFSGGSASAGLLSRGRLVGWTRGPWSHSLRPGGPIQAGPQAFGRAAASISEYFPQLVNWKELTGWVGAGCGSSPFPMAKAASPGHLV